MKKRLVVAWMLTELIGNVTSIDEASAQSSTRSQVVPPDEYIRNIDTAVVIADAVSTAMYGEQVISGERPLKATLHGDIWVVEGTLPAGYVGGVVHIEISKIDGRILNVWHGR
jgi:Na+-translocating ferredoxin:NAD+ oxidoreductase RnfG subunit